MLSMNKIAKLILVIMVVMLFMSLVVSLFGSGGNSGGIYVPEQPDLNIDLDYSNIIL